MKQVSFISYPGLEKNHLFNISSARDNALECFVFVKHYLSELSYECDTFDIVANQTDVLVFFDISLNVSQVLSAIKKNPHVRLIYSPFEPPIIAPLHESKSLKDIPVDRVLYWNDAFIEQSEIAIKCNTGQPMISDNSIPYIPFVEKKFLSAIYSNKNSNHPNGLYIERERAFKFFSGKKEKCDLYGVGWEKSIHDYIHQIYQGTCSSKKEILKQYKFSICFENATGYDGLVTEKIFDCFAAGTVPIYYGAPNINDLIPKECFIDFRFFRSYDDLYEFLTNISEEQYHSYLDAVKAFIKTPEYYEFTSKRYAEILTEQTLSLINNASPIRSVKSFKWSLLKIVLKNPIFILKNIRKTRHFLKDLIFAW